MQIPPIKWNFKIVLEILEKEILEKENEVFLLEKLEFIKCFLKISYRSKYSLGCSDVPTKISGIHTYWGS